MPLVLRFTIFDISTIQEACTSIPENSGACRIARALFPAGKPMVVGYVENVPEAEFPHQASHEAGGPTTSKLTASFDPAEKHDN